MNTKALVAIIVLLSLLLGWVLFAWTPKSDHAELPRSAMPTGGDFTLQSVNGPVSLEQYRGQVVLLYFGYTWCPDICPTALAMMTQAFNGMQAQELARIQGIFVSVDPERDTVDRLETYTHYFHPKITGVTGTPAQVARVAALYGAAYSKAPGESATQYTVDHTSYTYVIDPQGQLRASLPHGTLAERIREVVRDLLPRTP